jgi:hypothetical protein
VMICSSVNRLFRIDPPRVRIGNNNWIRLRGSRQFGHSGDDTA